MSEEIEPEVTDSQVVFPARQHRWRARGQEVQCTTCEHPHGFTLPIGTKLVGDSNGTPVLERVFDVSTETTPLP